MQLVVAGIAIAFPNVSLFQLVIATQALNAMVLPLVFYYLINLISNKKIMQKYVNNAFQKYFTIVFAVVIFIASVVTIAATVLNY